MGYSKQLVLRALLVLFVLIGSGATASESSEAGNLTRALTLREAVSRALANNPGIKAANLDVDIQQAHREAGALGTPYTMQAEVENFSGTDSASGFDSAETTLQLSKVLELGDKRRYRTTLGDARVSLARVQAKVRELELVAEVSRRYAELLKRQERIKLAAESVEINRRMLSIVEKRVEVGRTSAAERSTAKVTLSRAELTGRRHALELTGAHVRLTTLWGSTTPDFTQVEGDVYSVPELPPFPELKARLADNPELIRIATTSRIDDAKRRLAESRRRPDIELSAGVRQLAAADDTALVVAFSMPFGSSGRADALVRAADVEAAKTPLGRQVRSLELEATLFELYQSLLASRNELDTLREYIIPEAARAVQFYERGFELGSYSLLELTAAHERLLTLRGEALDTAASCHLALIEIESLTGNSNPGGGLQ